MATTTNYGWTTPDDTALVKDGAAAIRTLGSSVDTTTKALNPSTTLGDIEYRSSTANTNTRLGIGTNGQVLTVSGGVPAWTTAAGGGKVLQVVSATITAQTQIAVEDYTDSGITATITPTSSGSKILVIISAASEAYRASNSISNLARLRRGDTTIQEWNAYMITSLPSGSSDVRWAGNLSMTYLDAPATTSATTYKIQGKVGTTANSQRMRFQNDSTAPSTITLLEIGA
jgi:hypothetical protein